MSQRKWASWFMAAALFFIVATQYGLRNANIEMSSFSQSSSSYLNDDSAQAELELQAEIPISKSESKPEQLLCPEPVTCPEQEICPAQKECPAQEICPAQKECPTPVLVQETCPEPEKKPYLDLPSEYTVLSNEDQVCEDFYTEKYIQTIATGPRTLLKTSSAVTEFNVPTHPHHRKLNRATPVWLLQGVHWDPTTASFVAASDKPTKAPLVYGLAPLPGVRYDQNAEGCLASSNRQLVVYPALWESTYANIWHRLIELWQSKLSFDAMRIALDPATNTPYLTPEQIASANVVLPEDTPGPWGDLWKIVTPSPHAALPPSTLSATACYDVIIPTVGWASPFWSALLTSHYESCPRQTLLTAFTSRILAHFNLPQRSAAAVATRAQAPTITVIQRSANRKFRDFNALLEKMHARHPDSAINVVDLALLSTRDQLALAHSTDVWVGHHGAGMSYVLFMARTSAVVEILPPVFVSRGFRWLARMRGLVHFSGRAMWREEFEEKFEGKVPEAGWEPARQEDDDADGWQTEEWVWMRHEEILELVDAAVLSQRERVNDLEA